MISEVEQLEPVFDHLSGGMNFESGGEEVRVDRVVE